MWNPSLIFISNRFYRTHNNFGSLNDHMITEFSWIATMVIGRARHCHLAVTSPFTVTTVKTIVIASYLPYQVAQKSISRAL